MEHWKTLRISNARLGLDRLSAETSDDQFLRELVVNSMQAIQRSGVGDEIVIREAPGLEHKLMCADNGPGMSNDELGEKLNLFAGSTDQNINHGVGAKITTLTRNPHGVVYFCRTEAGENSRAMLKIDKSGKPVYQVTRCNQHELPPEIQEHGTAVILLGANPKQNTMLPPSGTAVQRKANWIVRYLGSKFYRLPDNIILRAPSIDTGTRRVHAQEQTLKGYCRAFGVHELSQAQVHWYILPPTREKGCGKDTADYSNARNYGNVAAHTAVLFEDEIYSVDQGPAALRKFGILTGLAVLYIEPRKPELYMPNTARSMLLRRKGRGSAPFILDEVAAEFRENMPLEIEKWQNELIEKSVGMNAERMLEKLFEVHGHHLIPQAKRELQAGIFEVSCITPPSKEEPDHVELKKEKSKEREEKRQLAHLNSSSNEQRGDTSRSAEQNSVQQRVGFPKITFVWVDRAGLEPGMFASFENGGRYILTLNKQWAGIEAVLRLLGREASKHEATIRKAAQNHLELLLADAIYSAYEQHEKKLITGKQLEDMLSSEALTAVGGMRYHLIEVLNRELKKLAA